MDKVKKFLETFEVERFVKCIGWAGIFSIVGMLFLGLIGGIIFILFKLPILFIPVIIVLVVASILYKKNIDVD